MTRVDIDLGITTGCVLHESDAPMAFAVEGEVWMLDVDPMSGMEEISFQFS